MRVLEGALVGQGEATLLTTIEQVDPIYVFFDQPAADFERLQRAQAAGAVTSRRATRPKCACCAPMAASIRRAGTLDFSDYSVNRDHRRGGVPRRVAEPGPRCCCRACT